MKKTYLILCLAFLYGVSVKTVAQIAPAAENLTHQWTFDDGTADDAIGGVNGVLEGNATVSNKALNTSNGGYVTLDATELAINTYTELTVETWFTSTANANTSYHMLYYFGDTNANGGGENYTCITPARGNNVSRAMLSTGVGGAGAEDGVDGPEYDDGVLHHMVCVISATTITFYIDGINMGTADLTGLNSLASIGSQFAYFAKGGYNADPTWKGNIHKISIYNAALTDENVVYLFQEGAEEQPVITTSASAFAFDTNYPAEMVTVTASNLSSDITITAPDGITVLPATLPANSLNAELTVIYDGATAVDGNIVLSSGDISTSIPVKCVSDETCYVPLYPDNVNLISDPGCNNLSTFAGWGTREIMKITTDPTNVFCGASSIQVGDGEKTGSGSLDFRLDGLLYPNTTYRVKMVVKTDGPFQLGVERIDLNNPTNNVIIKPVNTSGEWQTVDLTFATGEVVADNPVIYFNCWSLSGTIAYVDNWELYATPDPVITPTISSLALDPEFLSGFFNITSSNLTGDITITAPAGITVNPATLPASSIGELVTVTYDGTSTVDGNITLTSGSATANVMVKTAASSNTCFSPLYTDRPNLIPDPFFNDIANFNGWENRKIVSIIDYPDTVYCGSHCAKITNRGDIEVPLTDQLDPKHTYISKVMVLTLGGAFKMGINGHDLDFSGDLTDTVNTDGVWKEFTFEFNTGDSLRTTPVIFFNNDALKGKIAYLDNWELYKKDTVSAVIPVKDRFENLYVSNGKIVADFDVDNSSTVQLSVYNIQGSLVYNEKLMAIAGRNRKVVNTTLPDGMYIVRLDVNNESSYRKLIK